jgi:hypothetical protein
MGCDIHLYVEKKINGVWEKQTGFVSNWYDPGSDYFAKDEFKNCDSPYGGRNYSLFSFLADVRNYDGEIKPLAQPRGLPDDVSDVVKAESDDWDCDGHSHSYFTLRELIDASLRESVVSFSGYVDLQSYAEYKQNGRPNCWSGGVGGAIQVVSNKDG